MYDTYSPQEIKLAKEIAQTLDDVDSMPLHLEYARKYQEAFLRKQLNHVRSLPADKIKKSRAALYVYLVNKHSSNDSARY